MQFVLIQAINLPQAAARSIAHHGMSQFYRHCDAKAIVIQPVFPAIEHHPTANGRRTSLVHPAELIIFFQRNRFFHTFFPALHLFTETQRGTEEAHFFPPSLKTSVQVSPALPYRLVGQTGAALGAAACQNLAAVGGCHSLAEAVNLLAMQLLGLIGTFRCHAETPPVRIPVILG